MAKRRSKAGRPAKGGPRTPSGQRSRAGKPKGAADVKPNDRVLQTRETFASFKGGAAAEAWDPIGRAWLTGLLDGHEIEATRLRDAARQYASDYWQYFGTKTGFTMADLEPESRGSGRSKPSGIELSPEDPQGEWLSMVDRVLIGAGGQVRRALQTVTVDHFFFPDGDPPWLERLIRGRRVAERARLIAAGKLQKDEPLIIGTMPTRADHALLADLHTALRILITGRALPAVRAPREPVAEPKPLPPIDPAFLEPEDVPKENRRKGHMRPNDEIAAVILERHAAAQAPQGETA
jgi:hypothetical protein